MGFFGRALSVLILSVAACGGSQEGAKRPAAASPVAAAAGAAENGDVAVVGRDGPARVRVISLPTERGLRVAWSRDGRLLATTGRDRGGHHGGERHTVRLWDLSRGGLSTVLLAHRAPVTAIAFTPGEELVSGSLDGTLRIWNTRNGMLLGTLDHGRARREAPGARAAAAQAPPGGWGVLPVVAMDLSRDGNTLATTSGGTDVMLWGVAGSDLLAVLEGQRPSPRRGGAARPVGTHAPARGGHLGAVTSLAFGPDSRRLATGSLVDGTVRIWDAKSARLLRVLGSDGTTAAVAGPTSIAWSADGTTIGVGTARGTLELWDAGTGATAARFAATETGGPIASVAFRPSGSTLAAATSAGGAELWRLGPSPSFLTDVRPAAGDTPAAIEQVAWSIDGRVLAVASDGVLLARARDGSSVRLHAFVDSRGLPRWLAVAHDGHFDGDPEGFEDVELEIERAAGARERARASDVAAELSRPGLLADFFAHR